MVFVHRAYNCTKHTSVTQFSLTLNTDVYQVSAQHIHKPLHKCFIIFINGWDVVNCGPNLDRYIPSTDLVLPVVVLAVVAVAGVLAGLGLGGVDWVLQEHEAFQASQPFLHGYLPVVIPGQTHVFPPSLEGTEENLWRMRWSMLSS